MSGKVIRRHTKFSANDAYAMRYEAHDYLGERLGAQVMKEAGISGVYFSVWAPSAKQVYVCGSFNGWDPKKAPMQKAYKESKNNAMPSVDAGVWECFLTEAMEGEEYLFVIETWDGRWLYKTDPFAKQYTVRPTHNCVITDLPAPSDKKAWSDSTWMKKRAEKTDYNQPMNILEVHPGSFKRHEDGSFYTYTELSECLVEYVRDMGYTHVEFLGILEHPSDESWGYQVTGYFAPTSRYGTPMEFIGLVNALHRAGVGVILDWIPAHFATDGYSLTYYDGTPLFEYGHPLLSDNYQWGTKIFDYGKKEVQNFLLSSAMHWLRNYHIDGLRVDAVAAMLYLDYGKDNGQWLPNKDGGNTNYEAIALLQTINRTIHEQMSGVVTIAEESSAWPHCTGFDPNGLGFDYKWNMGWMHDDLEYMETDPLYRKYCHNKMTFSLTYENAEQFVLPLSHDEVVHLKKPMLYKMHSFNNWQQFAALKAFYTYMFGHPGKKLLFMGNDFGVRSEWNEKVSLDWSLLEQQDHRELQNFVRGLMHLYRDFPVMYAQDDHRMCECFEGFEWMECDDADRGIFSFVRKWKNPSEHDEDWNLLFLIHFTPVDRFDYVAKVPMAGKYYLVLDEAGYYEPNEEHHRENAVPRYSKETGEVVGYELMTSLLSYGVKVYAYK